MPFQRSIKSGRVSWRRDKQDARDFRNPGFLADDPLSLFQTGTW